jgi:hypothetical protein
LPATAEADDKIPQRNGSHRQLPFVSLQDLTFFCLIDCVRICGSISLAQHRPASLKIRRQRIEIELRQFQKAACAGKPNKGQDKTRRNLILDFLPDSTVCGSMLC